MCDVFALAMKDFTRLTLTKVLRLKESPVYFNIISYPLRQCLYLELHGVQKKTAP